MKRFQFFEKKNTAVLDTAKREKKNTKSRKCSVFTEARNVMRAEEAMALKATKKRCLSTAVVVGETTKRKVRGKSVQSEGKKVFGKKTEIFKIKL